MSRTVMTIMGTILWILSPFFMYGQGMMDPVSYTVTEIPEAVEAGTPFTLTVQADIQGKWHLYSVANAADAGPVPTTFTIAEPYATITDSVRESEPTIAYDPNFRTELGWHSNRARFTLPVIFTEPRTGRQQITLNVRYMTCDDSSCLPPKTKQLMVEVNVAGVAPTLDEQSTGKDSASDSKSGSSYGAREGMLSFLWIALTAGFAALITPCVFPMIPLTVSFFSKNSGQGRTQAVSQALIFGLAIVATFTLLGVLLSLVIGASGANQFAANPWVNLFIGLILIVFAVSLLGMFELRLPHQVTNYFNKKSNESSGVMGILFMALTISAVSFSCTAPFVGGVLAATAGGEWFFPIVGMAAFSAAFSTPFILFAMFPSWLESLPKSGSWMNLVKVTLGFIELAAAFKFISNADLVWGWNVVSRPLTISAWIVIFLLTGIYILGFITLKHEERSERIGAGRLLLSIPFLLFSFYLIPGLMGASLGIWDAWLPPKQSTDVSVVNSIAARATVGSEQSGEEGWLEDYDEAVAEARSENRPIFIDFTGYTCTNCRAMETNVFPKQAVQKHFSQMTKLRLYTDDGADGPDNQQFQFKLTGTVALPTYVVVDPYNGKVINQLVGYVALEQFNAFLERGISRFRSSNSGPKS